jgi:hypothetical protein
MTARNFVSRRHALTGTATLAGWLASGANAQTKPPQSGLRIGLIGCPATESASAGVLCNAAPLLAQTQMTVVAAWDPSRARATTLARGSSVTVVDRFDRMVGKVDGVLISDPRALAWRPQLATPYLKAGIPVWVDGALAPSVESAQFMIDTAERAKAALMSGVIEEFFPTTRFLRRKVNELAPITAAMVAVSTLGKPKDRWTGVEAVNVLCAIFGTTVAKVHRTVASESEPNYAITFEYRELKGSRPVHIVAQGMPRGADRLWARLYGTDMTDKNHILSEDAEEDGLNSFLPAALAMQKMFSSRKAPQNSQHLLAKTKLFLASCRSSSTPDRKEFAVVDLPDNWKAENAHHGYLPETLT